MTSQQAVRRIVWTGAIAAVRPSSAIPTIDSSKAHADHSLANPKTSRSHPSREDRAAGGNKRRTDSEEDRAGE
ncbi:hypothetical protein D0Z07_1686 [Hyphodiscus hymeniophilus]|uniref:Uncharacterized protein n=1 Tax=Hyphodiscus hymeniophilus TaxID=353542 RepID=A0A9P6VPD8_9HELO|nr:hypothetical protein D0Z07_1686 [Hyphodiscus hymeniophilus]